MSGDVVTVFVYRLGKSRAECSCGWDGPTRILRGTAVVDAQLHTVSRRCAKRCLLDQPLVCPVQSERPSLWKRLTPAPVVAAMPILIVPASLFLTPIVHASPMSFIQSLNDHGIVVYDTASAVRTGFAICDALNEHNGADVAEELFLTTTYTDVPTPEVAGRWVVTAVEQLCPQHDHRGQAAVA